MLRVNITHIIRDNHKQYARKTHCEDSTNLSLIHISIEKLFVILANVSFEALSVASLIDKLIRLKVDILERQLKPEARRDIIQKLAEEGIQPTSMMDICLLYTSIGASAR